MREVLEAVLALLASGQSGALATVVQARGSTPQRAGARLLLTASGKCVGTVGGGAIEHAVRAALEDTLRTGESQLLQRDLGRDLGMSCGGSMDVFIEPIVAVPRLIVCGAGHVGQATAALAQRVGFSVVVIDERADQNTADRFPDCERLLTSPAAAAETLVPGADDWVLLLSHSHALDTEALAVFSRQPHRYIGLMGSRRKIYGIVRELVRRGITFDLERVYAPVGLALAAVTPDEIAVSIVAELVSLRRGGDAKHLRALDDEVVKKLLSERVSACP